MGSSGLATRIPQQNAPSPVLPRPTLDRPPPKRLPVGEPSTSGAPSSVQSGLYGSIGAASSERQRDFPLFAIFSLQGAHICVLRSVLYLKRTKDSPSRVRFRPLPRLTFRFRVRPPGRASSYSRPVLGAAAIYALLETVARASDERKAANCDRPQASCRASTSSSPARARASGGRSRSGSRVTARR